MVDLYKLVIKYYYDPAMLGSNSIKSVLPAVLNASEYIQTKYSKAVYGRNSHIKSLNFEDGWQWIKYNDSGKMMSPYKLLPSIHEGMDENSLSFFLFGDTLADGGAALTAFTKLQYTQITPTERERLIQGLYKYCELDTLAMVMIWEYWSNLTHSA